MKKIILFFVMVLSSYIVFAESDEKIVFKDPNFEDIIRTNLYMPNEEIFESNLEEINKINVRNFSDTPVSDLNGIEKLKNLEDLYLEAEYIKDLTPLKNLKKLKRVEIYKPIAELSFLGSLSEIEELDIKTELDFDVKDIEKCTKLRKIYIHLNDRMYKEKRKIKNIELLTKFSSLTELSLYVDMPMDLEFLKEIKGLKKLGIGKIVIENMPELKELEEFQIENSDTKDASFLLKFSKLKKITIKQYTGIENIDIIGKLEGIKEFKYVDEEINLPIAEGEGAVYFVHKHKRPLDFSYLQNAKTLESIYISLGPREKANIDTFVDLPNLKKLMLYTIYSFNYPELKKMVNLEVFAGYLKNAGDIADCTKLKKLTLYGRDLTSIDSLFKLTELEYFTLCGTEVENIDVLKDMKKIRYLRMDSNKIKNIEALKNMKKLILLDLDKNKIQNIKPLTELENIVDLHLYNSDIKNIEPLIRMEKLQHLMIYRKILDEISRKVLKKLEEKIIVNRKNKHIGGDDNGYGKGLGIIE